MKKVHILAIAAMILSVNVFAQEGFDGLYGGMSLGYTDAKDHGKEIEYVGPSTWGQKNEPDGASISLNLGFNKVFENSVLVGIDGSLEKNFATDKVYQDEYGNIDTCCTVKSKLKESIYFGGKFGKIFQSNTLIYISAGKALKHIKRDFDDSSVPEQHSDNVWKNGWYYGAGIEKYISNNISVLFDYKRVDLGERNYYGISNWGIEKHDYRENNFKIGVNYYF
jgi:opacity protein-like surface antigen